MVRTPEPLSPEFEAWLRTVLETPAHEIDIAEGEALLDRMGMPIQQIGSEICAFDQDDYKLLAHLLLRPEKAERFLLNRAISEMLAWDTQIAALCLYRLGYNPDKHVGAFASDTDMSAKFRLFLNAKDFPSDPAPGLSPFLLQNLVDALCEDDGTMRSPFAVVDRKITLNPEILPQLLHASTGDDAFLAMDGNEKTFHQQRLKNAFDEVAVPQRLTADFTATQARPTDASPESRVIMIPPFRVLAENYNRAEAMAQFQKWLFWVQALLDQGVDVALHDTSSVAARRDTFTRDKFVLVNGVAYIPSAICLAVEDGYGLKKQWADYYGDITSLRHALAEEGVPMVDVAAWFEGGDIYIDEARRIIIAGTKGDGEPYESAARVLREEIAARNGNDPPWQICFLPEVNTHGDATPFYHRDLIMSPELSKGHRLFCPEATTPEAVVALKAAYEDDYEKVFIEIPIHAAQNSSLNSYGTAGVILSGNCATARIKLEALGYNVVTPTDYGLEHGIMRLGGIHCGTNELPPQTAIRPAN